MVLRGGTTRTFVKVVPAIMLCVQPTDHVAGRKGLIYKLAHACHIREWKNKVSGYGFPVSSKNCWWKIPHLRRNVDVIGVIVEKS